MNDEEIGEEIGKVTTTLYYLKVRYGWLGELIDEADTEIKRLRSALAQSIESVKANLAEVERLRAENAELKARRPDDVASGKRLFCDKCNGAWVADGKACCCCKAPFGAGESVARCERCSSDCEQGERLCRTCERGQ